MGARGEIVGYTACNDVSAWDIECDNPLYLPQSKIYLGCCALGPVLATAEEIPDPYDLAISCRIYKGTGIAFEGKVHSSQINRKFEEMVACLTKDNPVPVGTTVSTGTGIMPPNEASLSDGDRVEIEIERIGLLANTVRQL
jgi:2-dehydro-3-deoxy-D-arabinonate dehydratase